ncbi:Rof/RNase P-like protein [Russula compacta]|nr:Rof/RNase P-like protein [Russula compacta]
MGRVEGKMGRREAAEKGIWRLREEEARWEAFVPLHRLWMGYMTELLGLATAPPRENNNNNEKPVLGDAAAAAAAAMPQAAGMHAKLVKADFHGSIMTVRRSRNAALVGASGIVVQETENTFKVVTRKDKLKVLPKQGSVFAFAVPLYGTEPSAAAAAAASGAFGTNSGTKSCNDGGEVARTVLDGPHIEFELYGNQFCFRATDRAGRKFKHKETIEL